VAAKSWAPSNSRKMHSASPAHGDDEIAEPAEHDEEEVRVGGGPADAGLADAGHHLELGHDGYPQARLMGEGSQCDGRGATALGAMSISLYSTCILS
jgi:hypothetical protein